MDLGIIYRRAMSAAQRHGWDETELARQAMGESKKDTVRNWRRRLEADPPGKPGANMATVQSIATVLKVPLSWLTGDGPDDYDEYERAEEIKQQLLVIFESLPTSNWKSQLLIDAQRLKQLAQTPNEPPIPPRKDG